jgi:poly-gamma-glutamate capsule biosynthesis protein CapA/YwtB (metallophosphatase superfamily)
LVETLDVEGERERGIQARQRDGRIGSYDSSGSIETNVSDGFTLAAVGDVIVSRALTKTQGPGFEAVVGLLQDVDATFGNMETLIFDIRSFTGSPAAEYGGAYHVSLPEVGPDLRAMGFNIMGRANNHTLDWGLEGMRETSRILDESGIIHAGVGENLAQAGAARFLETARGRVGLVSLATTFSPSFRAADPAGEAPGRPGLNALRLKREITVTPAMLESMREVRDALPGFKAESDLNRVVVAGITFREASGVGFSYEPNSRDVANILRNIRRGKQFSDFCIVTNHVHQPGNWSAEPPDFEQGFAHSVIDAGADAYIAHGPHQLRGIEIHNRRPIFYGLGNFIYDDLRTPTGADMFEKYGKDPLRDTDADVTVDEEYKGYETDYGFSNPVFYESVIGVSRFEDNRLADIRLHPIELGHAKRFANRGVPKIASEAQGRLILERLQNLSRPFGTKFDLVDGVGLLSLR